MRLEPLATGKVESSTNQSPNWRVGCIDTGLNTMTGGRLKALRSHLGNESFMVTYGDGVADIDIAQLVDFHQSHGKLATVTAVRPPARFGGMTLVGDQVEARFGVRLVPEVRIVGEAA